MAKTIVLVTQGQQQYMKVLTSTAYRRGYSPYINEDSFWVVYDDDKQQYVTTDILARGIKGDQGDKGESGSAYILDEHDYAEIAARCEAHQMEVTVSGDELIFSWAIPESEGE